VLNMHSKFGLYRHACKLAEAEALEQPKKKLLSREFSELGGSCEPSG